MIGFGEFTSQSLEIYLSRVSSSKEIRRIVLCIPKEYVAIRQLPFLVTSILFKKIKNAKTIAQ